MDCRSRLVQKIRRVQRENLVHTYITKRHHFLTFLRKSCHEIFE